MEKIILTDCDGVITDWYKSFDRLMVEQGYAQVPEFAHSYSIGDRYGVHRDAMDDHVNWFNLSEHLLTLDPIGDAAKYVPKLKEEGFTFIAITSIGTDERIREARQQNLDMLFGEDTFDQVITIPIGHSKYPVLQEWEGSGYFWVEDKFSHAVDGMALGLKSILVEHDYNKEFSAERITKVGLETPWRDIYDLAQEHYG